MVMIGIWGVEYLRMLAARAQAERPAPEIEPVGRRSLPIPDELHRFREVESKGRGSSGVS
jgi:hypothetical protein